MAAAAPGTRFLVNGTRGGFLIDGFDIQANGSRRVPSERGRWDTFYPAVATALAGDGPPPVDPRDAVATAVVLDAARRSSADRTVVDIS